MLLALVLSLIAGLADVLGGFFAVAKKVNKKTLDYFISISAGFILAVTILDLYPEVILELSSGPLLILLGFVLIFMLENFFAVHSHHGEGDHEHTLMGKNFEDDKIHGHSVWAAYLGFLIHTFFDGAAIAARLLVSPGAGILVFIAVLSHKIPEGFSMASIFQSGGLKRKMAFLGASSLGLATVLGGMVVFLSGNSEFSLIFLALATGTFTYITTAELVPYISGTKDRKGILFFLLGILLFYFSSLLLQSFGLK